MKYNIIDLKDDINVEIGNIDTGGVKVLLYYQIGNALPTLVSETPSSTYANIVIPKKTLTNGLTFIKGMVYLKNIQ